MKLKNSHLVAILIALAVTLFFIVGGIVSAGKNKAAKEAKAAAPAAAIADPLVQVSLVQESSRPYLVEVRGRTEANKSVVVRAETAGPVAATPAREGAFVAKGTVLCRLSVDARQASLDQARALLRTRQLEKEASDRLAAQGYRSQTQVLQAQANLDGATATVRQAEVLLQQVNIRAPFSGVFDRRDAEIGAYLAPGGACGTMIQLDPLVIVADVAESVVSGISVGEPATAVLASGEVLSGRVRLVAREADAMTRTYRVEIEVNNPGSRSRSGLSAQVKITTGAGPALLVPTTTLVLDSAGRQGIRYLTADNRVAFAAVKVLDETPQGVWVSGIRGPARIIVVGQSYVSEGQKVRVPAAR